MHARRRGGDRLDIVDALRGLQNGVNEDRLAHRMLRLKLRQKLVEVVDVPGALDLGQHDDVELAADGGDDLDHVVERPGRVERVDAGPQTGRAEVVRLGHRDEARARRLFGIGRDGVFEIAEHDIDLRDQLRHLGAQLLDLRRHEMDHAFELHRQFAQRGGRADRERLEEIARKLHPGRPRDRRSNGRPMSYGMAADFAKPLLRATAGATYYRGAAIEPVNSPVRLRSNCAVIGNATQVHVQSSTIPALRITAERRSVSSLRNARN